MTKTIGQKFERLTEIMQKLRAPNGCPWDREQTPESITPYLLEETYETIEAISKGNHKEVCEELGDLLLQVVFQSQMAQEKKHFCIGDVVDGICEKLVRRHPHVFGELKVNGSKQVLENWEKIKKGEGKKSVLGGVPETLPALLKAYRLGQKVARVGFDWKDAEGVLAKVEEEARELHEAKEKGDPKEIEHEYGDLLLILANLGRFLEADPETALRKATERFKARFNWMEGEISRKNLDMSELDMEKWDELWEDAKKSLRG